MIFVTIPTNKLVRAIVTANETIHNLEKNVEEMDALGTEQQYRAENGQRGAERRAVKLAQLAGLNKQLVEDGQKKIRELRESALNDIHAQTDASGADLREAADDMAVLNANLCDSVEELTRIMNRHAESYTIFRMCGRYAKAHGWEREFEFDESKADSVLEYCEGIFQGLEWALESPAGMCAMQYCRCPGEFLRRADAYGLTQEFAMSHGEKMAAAAEDTPVRTDLHWNRDPETGEMLSTFRVPAPRLDGGAAVYAYPDEQDTPTEPEDNTQGNGNTEPTETPTEAPTSPTEPQDAAQGNDTTEPTETPTEPTDGE